MPSGSRPFVGSSSTSTCGSPSSAVASASRCRMPSEKPPAFRSAALPRPTRPSTSSARWSGTPIAAAYTRRWLRAVRLGWKPSFSSTEPTTRAGFPSCECGRPLIVAVPAVGVTNPSSIRNVVVFPAPFGPRKPVTEPGSTVKLRFCTAFTAPNCLLRFCTTIRPLPSCIPSPNVPADAASSCPTRAARAHGTPEPAESDFRHVPRSAGAGLRAASQRADQRIRGRGRRGVRSTR